MMGMRKRIPVLLFTLLVPGSLVLLLPASGAQALPAKLTSERIRETLRKAKLYFNGGGYRQARNLYAALLKHGDFGTISILRPPLRPPADASAEVQEQYRKDFESYQRKHQQHEERRLARQRQREEAMYHRARTDLALADTDARTRETAILQLLRLTGSKRVGIRRIPGVYTFDDPQYARQARYWAGRAELAQGRPEEAIPIFTSFPDLGAAPMLDAETAWYLTKALMVRAERLDLQLDVLLTSPVSERHQHMSEAIRELLVILLERWPSRSPVRDAVLKIRGHVRQRNYADAEAVLLSFDEQEDPPRTLAARTTLAKACCAFLRKEYQQAKDLFHDARINPAGEDEIHRFALYGLAWTSIGLGYGERKTIRREDLTFAQGSLRAASSTIHGIRDKYLEEATVELTRIVSNYAQTPRQEEAQQWLMRLRMDLGQHEAADALAQAYLKQIEGEDRRSAVAHRIRGQSAYLRGEIEKAKEHYEKAEAHAPERSVTHYRSNLGLGWCHAALARTAGAEQRARHLRDAHSYFRKVLLATDRNAEIATRTERAEGIHAWSEILTKLGEHEEALKQLQAVFDDPEVGIRAHYLAGVAQRGLGKYEEAVKHFGVVLRKAAGRERSAFLLETLVSLARLESERGQHAAALIYYQEAKARARYLQNLPLVAASDLGTARALLELGYPSPAAREASGSNVLRRLSDLVTLGADVPVRDLHGKGKDLAFSMHVHAVLDQAGPANYDRAREILARLRLRHSGRVRKDELDFLEGRALLQTARYRSDRLQKEPWLSIEAIRLTMDFYDSAAKILHQATEDSPRGRFAPRTFYELGRVLYAKGRFALRLSNRYGKKGRPREQQSFRQEGSKMLQRCEQPFLRAIKLSRDDSELRVVARRDLGETYYQLEEYEKAGGQFQLLADDPDLDRARQIEATRRWAAILDRLGARDEALAKLAPNAEQDLRSAVQAGKLLERLLQPQQAYETYLKRAIQERKIETDERVYAAEALYRAHTLALHRAEDLFSVKEVKAKRDQAQDQLKALTRMFPDTEWATRSLMVLGEYLLDKGSAKLARELVNEARRGKRLRIETQQAADLLEGRASVKAGDYAQAEAAFGEAAQAVGRLLLERQKQDGFALTGESEERIALCRQLAATAMRERGDAAQKSGKRRRALDWYRATFAEYSDVKEQADLARMAAARLQVLEVPSGNRQAAYELAKTILDGGHDRRRMRAVLDEIEKIKNQPE